MPDAAFVRELVEELARVTSPNYGIADETLDLYAEKLASSDAATLSEACSRLMQSATKFPSLGEIVETCRMIRAEAERLDASEPYSRKEWLAKPRVELWMTHLRETLHALKHNLPRPDPPEPLDTSRVTFKCYHCQDTGFVRACTCGNKKACRLCRYEYFQDCACRPPRLEPIKTQTKRFARA